jgi:hypothetical protein
MNSHSEIDETLARLGGVEPPAGLARRVELRLDTAPSRSWITLPRAIAACGVAASVAASAVVLDPGLRHSFMPHHNSAQTAPLVAPARVAPNNFGAAADKYVPVTPVPVQPTPLNHGRGRSRSGRMELPAGSQTALPRGVAAPAAVPAQ